jgi:hypothetical protein
VQSQYCEKFGGTQSVGAASSVIGQAQELAGVNTVNRGAAGAVLVPHIDEVIMVDMAAAFRIEGKKKDGMDLFTADVFSK